MDKIKPYLLLAKKHHFWILVVILVFVSAYAWYSGTAAYDAEFTKNKSAVSNAFTQARSVSSIPNPPNPSFAENLKTFQQQQIQSTLSAWQTLYDQQKNVLVWSRNNDQLANLKPEDEIPEGIRAIYLNYFRSEFPKLFEIVQPLRQEQIENPDAKNANGRRGAAGGDRNSAVAKAAGEKPKVRMIGIVDWPDGSRDSIRGQYDWQRTPTSTQVRLAQEDYWVYKALLQIIAETNKSAGATNNTNAAIKRIDQFAIAQAAVTPPEMSIDKLPADAGGAPAGAAGTTQGKVTTANSTDEELLDGRYATVDAGASGGEGGGGTEFRLIPVRMRFRMDERRIPNLLVACANSPLTVEVEPVLYNPGTKSGGTAQAQSSGGGGPQGKGEIKSEAENYEATVEVRGVAYIFNAPSKAALGLPEEAAAEPGATDGTTPDGAATEPPPADAPVATPPADAGAQPQPDPAAPTPDGQPAAGSTPDNGGAATGQPADGQPAAPPAEPQPADGQPAAGAPQPMGGQQP